MNIKGLKELIKDLPDDMEIKLGCTIIMDECQEDGEELCGIGDVPLCGIAISKELNEMSFMVYETNFEILEYYIKDPSNYIDLIKKDTLQ